MLILFLLYKIFIFIHLLMCIHCLGHFSLLPLAPSLFLPPPLLPGRTCWFLIFSFALPDLILAFYIRYLNWACWSMPITPELGRLGHEASWFKVNLSNWASPCLKKIKRLHCIIQRVTPIIYKGSFVLWTCVGIWLWGERSIPFCCINSIKESRTF
jgi:hypothetical protein